MEPRYTIGLISIAKKENANSGISLKGPYTNLSSFNKGKNEKSIPFPNQEVLNWNESVSLPLLPTPYSAEVFGQPRKSPWLALNDQNNALDLTENLTQLLKKTTDYSSFVQMLWKVYKGASFDL